MSLPPIISNLFQKYTNALPENLAKLVMDAESVDSKLDRLTGEPFSTGLSHLKLSVQYPNGSKRQTEEVMKARDCFIRAASVSRDAQEATSFYFAGRCSEALQDEIGKKHFYRNAAHSVDSHHKKQEQTFLDLMPIPMVGPLVIVEMLRTPFQIRSLMRLRKMRNETESYWDDDMLEELGKHDG